MFTIKGKYAEALITTDNIEVEAIAQVTELVNHPASMGSKIAIMPDVHAGKGSVVGTTMTITDRVVPNLVGVDVGCGVLALKVPLEIDFVKLQEAIDKHVPSGMSVHQNTNKNVVNLIADLKTPISKSVDRIMRSLGTLGGGNHFIAIEGDEESNYLIIHTGSRNLGVQVAKYHQEKASTKTVGNKLQEIIDGLKAKGETSKSSKQLRITRLRAHTNYHPTKT
jgi:tRNA-splicing ligase RtcB (3'-phosphate/5'-hydroxy nucleic acid ligase)